MLVSILELLAFLNFSSVQNLYVQIALNRLVEFVVCLELVVGLAELLAVATHGVGKTSSSLAIAQSMLFALFFTF